MDATSPYYPRPTHGEAFAAVMEESALLDDFIVMIKKKIELDEQHLRNLIALQGSWNAQWRESVLGPLASPLLTYFEDEITQLTHSRNSFTDLWTNLPTPQDFAFLLQGDIMPLQMRKTLEELFSSCYSSHEAVKVPTAKAELRSWYSSDLGSSMQDEKALPQLDRAYRTSVTARNRYIETADKWYTSDMEEILERHQQYAEDIKKLVHSALYITSRQLSHSLTSCSSAVQSIDTFASTQFIATHHDQVRQERGHLLLQKYDYYCYYRMDEGEILKPLFGLGAERLLELVGLILDNFQIEWDIWPLCTEWQVYHSRLDYMLQLEKRLLQRPDVFALLKEDHRVWPGYSILHLQLALWSENPFLPISQEQLVRYESQTKRSFGLGLTRSSDVRSRRKLEYLAKVIDLFPRTEVAELVSRLLADAMSTSADRLDRRSLYVTSLLTHRMDVEWIIKELWNKWDFIHACPLSVERTSNPTVSYAMPPEVPTTPPKPSDWNESINHLILGRSIFQRYYVNKQSRAVTDLIEFEGVDKVTDTLVTVKMTSPTYNVTRLETKWHYQTARISVSHDLLAEYQVYSQHFGTDNLHYFGNYGGNLCLITERLGPDLGSLFIMSGNRFSVKTVAMCAKQMITQVEAIHLQGAIYPDIKPHNFVIGLESGARVYITGFDLARRWSPDGYQPRKIALGAPCDPPNGDEIFLSARAQNGEIQGRSDDLEALSYILVYLLRCSLPWQNLGEVNRHQLDERMFIMKKITPAMQLCEGLPKQLTIYLDYIRDIGPNGAPDYEYLRDIFQSMLEDIGESDDGVFDWNAKVIDVPDEEK